MAENGTLIVRVTTARSALPVEGAVISVVCPPGSPEGQEIPCRQVVTDRSGQSEPISLPAPSSEGSTNPEEASGSYYSYIVQVEHPGYRPMTILNVSSFSGIDSTLPVTMIPIQSEEEAVEPIVIDIREIGPSGSGEAHA